MSGMEWIPYAASAAATAASGAYASNQANQTSSGNAYMANMTNMVMQAQNQDYNSAEAVKGREFNSAEAAMSRDWQGMEADRVRAFNADQAQKNRDFQAGQSATAYQRAVKDMMAAGLNPMLAYSQGGASTASGSAASASNPSGATASSGSASSGGWAGAKMPDVHKVDMLGGIMNSALDMKMKEATIDKISAEAQSIRSGTDVTQQSFKEMLYSFEDRMRMIQLGVKDKNYDVRFKHDVEEIRKEMEQTELMRAKGQIGELQARTRALNASAKLDELGVPAAENASRWAQKSGMTDSILNTVGKGVGTAAGIAGTARMLRPGASPGNYSETYYGRGGQVTGGKSRDYQ